MSGLKNETDQTRRFGFKETREQYEHRKKQEKQTKWNEKLSKENVGKLRKELDSLERARFLSPQQNERKRLVQRMIKDLESKNKPEEEVEEKLEKEVPPPPESDSDDDDLFFSRGLKLHDEDKQLFIPRKLRRKEDVEKVAEVAKDSQQIAEEAEKELLAAQKDDEDLDAFLGAL